MKTPSYTEDHISQIPALQLLINMGYKYINEKQALEMRSNKKSQVLLEGVLKKQLQVINSFRRKGVVHHFSESNINSAILTLKDLPIQEGFINANLAMYDLITLGKSMEQTVDGDKKSYSFKYIDWDCWQNNVFHVTEEYSVQRSGRSDTYRPDLVLFVNGIPLSIIECKSTVVGNNEKSPTDLAVEQHIRNFEKNGIRSLYLYSNILISIASNDGSYATTGTSKEYWSKWKEQFSSKKAQDDFANKLKKIKNIPLSAADSKNMFAKRFKYVQHYFSEIEKEERLVTKQDEILYSICNPERFLDLMRNFILYDDGIKKIARYQQYFAVKDTMDRVSHIGNTGKREGGVIWHTQGSGKSLTMVMLAQILASSKQIKNPKIILVTDRIDLDDQISDTFKKCNREVKQARTGIHLSELICDKSDAVITTIINKFVACVKQNETIFTSPDIFVLIDEGHRTQYGTFNVSMRQVFSNACFLAFTGTPLMKKEKSTAQKFGGYIGIPYTVKDAVNDGAVVPLLYEGRHNLFTIDEKPLNRFFDKVSEPLSDYGKVALKRKFNTINELNRAEKVIYERALDISEHYCDFFQTHNDKYKPKAQLVAPTIKTALLYKKYLDDFNMVTSEVVVSQSDQREGVEDGFYNVNEDKLREDSYFNAMIDKYGDLKKFEKNVISQFKKQEHPEILIVVAKLLTGFDAPCNTILYLCRSLKEHTLLQAIARVNRVFPGKDFGYIIDYYGNLEHLDQALSVYTNLESFDKKDLEDTITDLKEEVKKLPQAHAELWDIFKELRNKNVEATEYEVFLSPEDIRNDFYDKLSKFARLLKLSLSSLYFVKNTDNNKIEKYKEDAKFFLKLRVSVKRRYNDDLAYKEFEPQIQKLINKHISTEGEVIKVTEIVNIFDREKREAELEKIEGRSAKADHIASRTSKAIQIKMHESPIFYDKLADLIKETIDNYYQKRLSEVEYLFHIKKLETQFLNGSRNDVPAELKNNEIALTFYDFCKDAYLGEEVDKTKFHIECSLEIDATILKNTYANGSKIIDWNKDADILGQIAIKLGDKIYELLNKYNLDTDWDIIDKLMEQCLKVAVLRA
ncbi:type I restriction endonuclease subunit R [Tenacibaculum finnmarkense]|uniref:type I restriction endonuclease subunit R n=1 Tax=Tenacibaculum finnmarkense TaxID=2781243 RepID=UPI00187BA5C4|nr:HsdR family type I site-specific deoxyribonuclease [Tenacibaculum finnmarkense]MBE7649014.1 HsdR family type I site-specific deoxyribonuclease [Tenacibaculum finnmarkense genomovar ulcerans]